MSKISEKSKLEVVKEYLELALLTSENKESSKFYLNKANDHLEKIKKNEKPN